MYKHQRHVVQDEVTFPMRRYCHVFDTNRTMAVYTRCCRTKRIIQLNFLIIRTHVFRCKWQVLVNIVVLNVTTVIVVSIIIIIYFLKDVRFSNMANIFNREKKHGV